MPPDAPLPGRACRRAPRPLGVARLLALAGLVLAMLAAGSPGAAAVTLNPTGSRATVTVRETRVSPIPSGTATRSWEPSVAGHPTDPLRVAVAYAHGVPPVRPQVRISHDGGLTWRTTAARPGGGGYHIIIAWGPGPVPGRARLYLANMAGSGGGVRLGTTYSDDEGAHWSPMRIQTSIPAWVGGTPDIVTDNNPASPNYGTVYAAWNWPASPTAGPGLHVIASSDFGRTWHAVEVPALARITGFPARHRIGYRLAPAPDGSVYVSWYQADLRRWSSASPLVKGSLAAIGRIHFGVARLVYRRVTGTWSRGPSVEAARLPRTAWNTGYVRPGGLTNDPQWTGSIKVDPDTGCVSLAASVDGGVRVFSSIDQGKTWTSRSVPAPPMVNGRSQYIAKPDLVVGAGFMLIAMRMFDRSGATGGHAYSISTDRGATWSRPVAVGAVRWASARVAGSINGVGLRNRAAVLADGVHVVFAYGDGRYGAAGANRVAVFAARITVTLPAPTPTPTPTPAP